MAYGLSRMPDEINCISIQLPSYYYLFSKWLSWSMLCKFFFFLLKAVLLSLVVRLLPYFILYFFCIPYFFYSSCLTVSFDLLILLLAYRVLPMLVLCNFWSYLLSCFPYKHHLVSPFPNVNMESWFGYKELFILENYCNGIFFISCFAWPVMVEGTLFLCACVVYVEYLTCYLSVNQNQLGRRVLLLRN